jgi:tetratricopeptide (TPR) repeat protein
VNLGLILASQSRLEEANQVLLNSVRIEPNNAKALTASAMVETRLNRQSNAMETFRKVTALNPNSPEAHLNLGIALADQFNLESALTEFSEAVKLAPEAAAGHYNKGRVLLDLQRNAEAKPELEAAVRVDPKSANSWYLLGLIAKQAGDSPESIKLFEKTVALDPRNADAMYMLGQEMQRNGDRVGAISRWRRVLQIDPQHSQALYNLSRILTPSDPDEAKELQKRFEALQAQQHITDRAQTLGNFALASAAAHDFPQAISQLKEAIQLCENCSTLALLHKDLGLIYCRSGDLRNGLTELQQAQKLTPADPDVSRAMHILQSAHAQ